MIGLYTKKLGLSTLGAIMVISGVVVKNSHEQMKKTDVMIPMIGMGLFLVGWVVTVFSGSLNNIGEPMLSVRTIMSIISVIMIVLSVMVMKGKIQLPETIPKFVFPGMFILGWIGFGYSLGLKHESNLLEFNRKTMIGITGASMIIVSMLMSLPWQRKNNIVDGPGMPLFVAGWGSIIMGNSMR